MSCVPFETYASWLFEWSLSVVKATPDMYSMPFMPNAAEACEKGVCSRYAHTGLCATMSVKGSCADLVYLLQAHSAWLTCTAGCCSACLRFQCGLPVTQRLLSSSRVCCLGLFSPGRPLFSLLMPDVLPL